MDDFRISVIITAYNNARYLADTIDSVLAQTLPPHEIIVTDDCSQDESPAIIRRYMAAHPDLVKGLFQPENVFIPRNRNAALATATGNWVAVLDGDDRYLPRNLELLAEAVRRTPGAGVAYSNLFHIDPAGRQFKVRDATPRPSGDLFAYIATLQMGLLRSMIVRRDLIERLGGFNPAFPHHDGYLLTLQLAQLTPFAYSFTPSAEYRVHPQSTSKMDYRVKLGFMQEVAAEVYRQTRGLPVPAQRRVRARWAWRLRHLEILADVAEGRQGRALRTIARGLLRPPRHVRPSWRMLRYTIGSLRASAQPLGIPEP